MNHTIEKGQLWAAIERLSSIAKGSGALVSIATEWVNVKDHQFDFIVRVAKNIGRKTDQNKKTPPSSFNPFLPPDPELLVGHLSDTHSAVLNKFNVVEHHLLMVTREYESQESPLTIEDFQAMCFCLAEREGVAFFNGGASAGASQAHKHLQWVPAPLVEGWQGVGRMRYPIEVALLNLVHDIEYCVSSILPFNHLIAPLHGHSGVQSADHLLRLYKEMSAELGVEINSDGYCNKPYNLLMTRDWMMIVPRTSEHFENISINSLAFAGSLFVSSQEGLDSVRDNGPLTMMTAVCEPS